MTTTRIILADDHTLVRAGIRALLEPLPYVEVVAEAGDGHEVLRLVEEHQPDLVLMDIAMEGLNGLEAAEQISRDFPAVGVIILSMYSSEEYVMHAMRAGAVGYMLKDSTTAELEFAVQAVRRGETYLSPAVSKHVVEYIQRTSGEGSLLEQLTPRQRQILQLIAEGKSTQGIALALGISAKTVETHRSQLMERLDIHDVAGLVRYAIRSGVATLDE